VKGCDRAFHATIPSSRQGPRAAHGFRHSTKRDRNGACVAICQHFFDIRGNLRIAAKMD
jgi:hypothetical protein